jgi:hypothetical protein
MEEIQLVQMQLNTIKERFSELYWSREKS